MNAMTNTPDQEQPTQQVGTTINYDLERIRAINQLGALAPTGLAKISGLVWESWDTGGGLEIPTTVVGHDADGHPEWWMHYGCEDSPALTLYRGPEDFEGLTFTAPPGWVHPTYRLRVIAEWIREVALLATEAYRGHNQ